MATVVIKVIGETSADENLLTSTLMEELNTNVRGIELDRQKEDPTTLDPGTMIVAILGTQFALELAKTLHSWLMRNYSATLTLRKDGELEVTGVSPDTVEEIVKAKLGAGSAMS